MSMARRARSRRWSRGTFRAASPSSTLSCTVSQGSRAKLWNTIARLRLGPRSGSPWLCTWPWVGWISPAMIRSRVLLPLPLRPSSATTSPARTERLTSCSTVNSPLPSGRGKRLDTRSTLISGIGACTVQRW